MLFIQLRLELHSSQQKCINEEVGDLRFVGSIVQEAGMHLDMPFPPSPQQGEAQYVQATRANHKGLRC